MSFPRKIASVLFVCVAFAVPLSAQTYPMPGKDTAPPVLCTGCPNNNVSEQPNDGLPTFPYSAPIVRHVGRMVDSSNTQDVQNVGIRTIRAGVIRTAPNQRGSAPPRVYMQLGGAVGAYSLSSLFTTTLPGGMVAATRMGAKPFGAPGTGRGLPHFEKLTMPDAYIYAENKESGFTNDVCPNPSAVPAPGSPDTGPLTSYCDEPVGDRQEVLFDFDFDDRGYIYPAYGVFGWAPVRDDGTTGGGQFARVAQNQQVVKSARIIVSLKVGQNYYVVSGVSSFTGHRIYDVTNPSPAIAPRKIAERTGNEHMIVASSAAAMWSKNEAAQHLAYIDRNFDVRIYDYASFVSGAPPLKVHSSDKGFNALSYDENGILWAAEKGPKLWKLTPSGSTYVATSFDVYGGGFTPNIMHAGGGYVVVGGTDSESIDVRLIRVKGSAPQLVDLKQFFAKYYHYAPAGYAQPTRSYLGVIRGLQLMEHGGKTYLFYNAHGMSDVYEIEGGEGVSATIKNTTFGTPNPNAKSTETGPFHGDSITFRAVSNNPQSNFQVEWNFGNSESGFANLFVSNLATDVTHQYTGISTAAAIGTLRQVKASAVDDPSVSTTLPLTLKVPLPRIGLPNGTALSASAPDVDLVVGESFTDASDGSVEGHFGTWTVDGTPTKRLPSGSVPVGDVGVHTLAFNGTYGRYDAETLTPAAGPYVTPTLNVTYKALPFLFTLNNPAKTTIIRFSATARKTSDIAVLSATTWTYTWTLKNGLTDIVAPQTGSAAVGAIPNFDIPLATVIPSGSVVKLDVVVDPAGLSVAALPYATYSKSLTLSTPDPKITITGCANAVAPCTFTAGSILGQSLSDWTLLWELKQGSSTVKTGTGTTLTGAIANAGSYTIVLNATKTIFDAKVQEDITVGAAVCGPPPTVDQLAITSSCSTCEVNETVTFKASVFNYKKQTCDVWSWNFGDGTTGTGDPVTHKFTTAKTYTVKLTASNPNGQTPLTTTITVGGGDPPPPPPPPPCAAPANILFSYSGNQGCSPQVPCKTGESIRFTGYRGLAPLASCDLTTWEFGDASTSTSRSPSKTYSTAGTFTVKLTVRNTSGQASATEAITVIPGGSSGSCSKTPTDADFYYDFVGAESGCTGINGKQCKKGESIQFTTKGYLYTFQECDKFEWTFGDGTTSTLKSPAHTFAGSAASYTVVLRLWNQNRPEGYTFSNEVPFDGAPVKPTPELTYSTFPTTGAKDQTITFVAASNISATGWRWNFGDGTTDNSQNTVTSTTSTITHKFTSAGAFDVTVTARNAEDSASAPTSSRVNRITVSDQVLHRFMIPVAVHGDGVAGSVWRTDIQIYHPTASPTVPLQMKASFLGTEYDLEIKQSTFIYGDFIGTLLGNLEKSGPIIISTLAQTPPQIWSRTYNLDPSGRTFGQFIPAVYLNTGGAAAATAAQPKYYLAGLRQDSRYRTNVGFVNPTLSDITVNVAVYDDLKFGIGQFAVTLAPFQLTQFGIANPPNHAPLTLPARPLSLEISVPQGSWLIAYGSLIDGSSNDPVYIPAVYDGDVISEDFRDAVMPGVGHIGDWRSDVTIYNADVIGVEFDLVYYDGEGLERGTARGIRVPPLQFVQYQDLLRANLFSPAPPDGVGSLRIKTVTPSGFVTNRFPIGFARTYNDKGSGGTFGQGINSFAAARANVKAGQKAIIPAVRSSTSYKTNIGLTNVTATPVNVIVTLLDPNTGMAAKQEAYTLAAYQSLVGEYNFGGLELGTLEITLNGSQGAVWAFASVIDRSSNDPEYVPAVPLP